MKKFICLLVGLHLWSGAALAQSFNATVNRTEVPQGETFLLTLETDDDKTTATPDLSVLEPDFNIYSVGNAYQSSYVNGVSTHSRQWQIMLMPKTAGQIQIPAIKLGKLSSQPIELNVVSSALQKQGAAHAQDNAPKFAIDAQIDNTSPYVQQQINYTLNIYDSGGLYGEEPVFMDSGNGDWIIKSLGAPVINSKIINGRQLREIQFKYALFPQKSGALKTPDVEFRGYYLTRSRRGSDPFDDVFNSGFFDMGFSDMFATRNPVVLKPESKVIKVKAVPADNGGYWWLPASKVTLSAEWENNNPTFKVGEAVSRSVYLKASGVIENQLPDIKFADIKGVKQYPDKPVAMSSQQNGEVVSVKKFSNVFIPETAGKMTIPAVTIDWYNIHTRQLEKATLPAITVKVLPSASGDVSPTSTLAEPQPQSQPQPQPQPLQPHNSPSATNGQITFMLLGAFVMGLLLSYALFGLRGGRSGRKMIKFYQNQVKTAADKNDLKALRDNLLAWARLSYDAATVNNVDDIAKLSADEGFKTALAQLSQALYAPRKNKFDTTAFLKAFNAEQKRAKRRKKVCAPLPELYK